jgi:hypothetical protein
LQQTARGSEFQEVVNGAQQRPFALHRDKATPQELAEAARLFDLPKHQLDDLLARWRCCARSPAATSPASLAKAEAAAMTLLGRQDPVVTALGRAVLQCYYRDDRVMRALGVEPRPPYPKGPELEQGDWSLLETVRSRPRMWRDIDATEK